MKTMFDYFVLNILVSRVVLSGKPSDWTDWPAPLAIVVVVVAALKVNHNNSAQTKK